MTVSRPDYSIIIPAFNEAAYLGSTLAFVRDAQTYLPNRSGEVIIVDNNSTDQTAQIAKSFDCTVVFEPINQISRARNRGAEAAKGKYLIFLDADTTLSEQLLIETLKLLDSGQIAGGGTVLDSSGTKLLRVKLLIKFWNFISKFRKLAAGLYLFCLKQAWVDIGGFDETVYIAEELIFSKHLKKWAKKHNMNFRILDIPIQTSLRKFYWFSYKKMVFNLAIGFFVKGNKDKCRIWYERKEVRK
ncbi:MAG: glycosyltransferase [Sedimentisphaerales bacterium]